MVLRIAEIVEQYVVELGDEGNLIVMRLDELLDNPTEDQRLLVMDYCVECKESAKKVLQQLGKSSSEERKDLSYIGKLLGYEDPDLESPLRPRGYRGTVEGIGEVRARSISRGLKRLREQCLIARHF